MPGAYGAADPLWLLLAALAAEAYLGGLDWGLRGWTWPRRRFAELLRGLQRRLDRPQRSAAALRRRGLLVAALLLLLALAAGFLLGLATRHYPFAWAVELLLLYGALKLRRSHRQARHLLVALTHGRVQVARDALVRLAAGDLALPQLEALPAGALAATARSLLERRLADAAVAPVIWFALLGLPGLFVWTAVERAALSLAGPRLAATPPAPFAAPMLWLDRLLRRPPALLAGLLLELAARLRPEAPADPAEALRQALGRHVLAGLLLAGLLLLAVAAGLLLRLDAA